LGEIFSAGTGELGQESTQAPRGLAHSAALAITR
jgi:hypothetical protein